jgi:hypothetical protein
MTDWGVLILVAAVFLGLKGTKDTRNKYTAVFLVVVAAVGYAAVRQHIF